MIFSYNQRQFVAVSLSTIVEDFEIYNSYSSEILQGYLVWHSALLQYVSKNSVELLDCGETLIFGNWPFLYILGEPFQVFETITAEILQSCNHMKGDNLHYHYTFWKIQ